MSQNNEPDPRIMEVIGMLENTRESDTSNLRKIDTATALYFYNMGSEAQTSFIFPSYSRSRDDIKRLRPVDWVLQVMQRRPGGMMHCILARYDGSPPASGERKSHIAMQGMGHTEELAELAATLLALEFERNNHA